MRYVLDVWLERAQPLVRVWEAGTGRLLLRLDQPRLEQFNDRGLFAWAELATADREESVTLAERLLAASGVRRAG